MISQEVIFEWADEFETEKKLEAAADKRGGKLFASGLGMSGREVVFEYTSEGLAKEAEKEMETILSDREHSVHYYYS